jgi:murein DD-endopeptidase MepM/ murein hydrolase activator NlpD
LAPGKLTGYRWPLPRGRLTLPFGPSPWGSRIVGGEQFHDGIDLATSCGDRIVAAHSGRVIAAGRRYDEVMGWRGDLGPYLRRLEKKNLWITLPIVVVVEDGNGYRSIYAHFGRLAVKRGQVVRAGQLLGYEGATGRASGCHLHYGLFAPAEQATFGIREDVVKRMRVPALQTARIDPLLVLPPRTPNPRPAVAPPGRAAPGAQEGLVAKVAGRGYARR